MFSSKTSCWSSRLGKNKPTLLTKIMSYFLLEVSPSEGYAAILTPLGGIEVALQAPNPSIKFHFMPSFPDNYHGLYRKSWGVNWSSTYNSLAEKLRLTWLSSVCGIKIDPATREAHVMTPLAYVAINLGKNNTLYRAEEYSVNVGTVPRLRARQGEYLYKMRLRLGVAYYKRQWTCNGTNPGPYRVLDPYKCVNISHIQYSANTAASVG